MSLENYGNYQLLKKLATGGMAQIYLARRKGPEASDELVVVKRILPHLGENKEFVQMFLDEAKIAARLAHPNIVAVYDLGAQDESFFIAMEYIHGEDVRRMCKRANAQGLELPVPLACRIVIDACAGLDYAHKKTDPTGKPLNIVHRDISPQNILVSFQGEVKVVDFGIAKAADQATVTRSGVLKGKYSYMSPEQAAGKRVDCRSDVFALGVVLYELLTGTRLFKRASDMQTLSAVAECNVTLPSQVNPRVPVDLDPIVMKALAKEPEQRYAEASQLQDRLEEWLRTHQLASTPKELAGFLHEVYEERLAREQRSGSIVVEDEPPTTGQRTAVGGHRRSGTHSPPVSSKEVTRADRGEALSAAADEKSEATDPTAQQRPSRNNRVVDVRRETEPERPRVERQVSGSRPVTPAPARRLDPAEMPTQALDEQSLALSMTGTTQAPRRDRARRRWMGIVAAVTAAAMVIVLGIWLWPSGPPPATVLLETVPPGARVVFEGDALTGMTPLTLPAMPAGTYQVVVSREGYEELRVSVAIPATGRLPLAPLTLKPVSAKEPQPPRVKPPEVTPAPNPAAAAFVKLTLETEPVQATIFVDGKERGLSPQVLEAKADQELEVKVTAPQFRLLEQRVKVKAGPAQVEILKLEPLPKTAPTPPIKPIRVDPPKPPPPEPAATKALVRFAVTPWAEVSCNGRNLGSTPFQDVALPLGTYQCKFHNPDLGRTISRSIEVRALPLNTVKVKF
ncbi:serine/threonine-protein kinase [Hyalangium sp.]|uniref:serine/threonine-protein kinase n=1 Tax=Hyalangium sp. TaxID=2028555 RepID=UPI002D3E1A51|nr:serine/threonine-protein kinase [Hyalangium sp.]HYH97554.1 serine/threonine-protein kinase [Hyalangium sp.]